MPYIDNLYKIKTEENIMAVDKSLISGSTSMLLLRLLEEKDMYGYEMIETLEKKSNNVFTLKAGTLYPLLHSLEEKNYLKSYESEANGKTRKYYSITKEGKKYLKSKREEWNEYQTAVANVLCFAE
jgi:DNA-binding PadR family transcriptional regulator